MEADCIFEFCTFTEVKSDGVLLSSGKFLPCGLVVWSAGVAPIEFTKQLPFAKNKIGQVSDVGLCGWPLGIVPYCLFTCDASVVTCTTAYDLFSSGVFSLYSGEPQEKWLSHSWSMVVAVMFVLCNFFANCSVFVLRDNTF